MKTDTNLLKSASTGEKYWLYSTDAEIKCQFSDSDILKAENDQAPF